MGPFLFKFWSELVSIIHITQRISDVRNLSEEIRALKLAWNKSSLAHNCWSFTLSYNVYKSVHVITPFGILWHADVFIGPSSPKSIPAFPLASLKVHHIPYLFLTAGSILFPTIHSAQGSAYGMCICFPKDEFYMLSKLTAPEKD